MIRSMTGYAAALADSPRGALGIELRSVNSRFLDVAFRVAEDLRSFEPLLRELIGERVSRGKVDCRLFLGPSGAPAGRHLDEQAVRDLRRLAEDARRHFPEAAPLRVADVLRWPGVIAEAPADEGRLRAAVEALARRGLDDLLGSREREGAKLAAVVSERIASMRRRIDEVAPLVPESVAAYEQKLRERLREAIGSSDDDRIRAEIALFAARSDVGEELDRLRAHLTEAERTLAKGGLAGKRLDFLAQELNREANTLASKAASQAIAACALELKLLVEQVREQVQNIE